MIKTKNNKNKANPMAFDLSSNLIQEIIPLYLISVLGFVAGRFFANWSQTHFHIDHLHVVTGGVFYLPRAGEF